MCVIYSLRKVKLSSSIIVCINVIDVYVYTGVFPYCLLPLYVCEVSSYKGFFHSLPRYRGWFDQPIGLQAFLPEDGNVCLLVLRNAPPSLLKKEIESLEMASASSLCTPECIPSDPVDFCTSNWLRCFLVHFLSCRSTASFPQMEKVFCSREWEKVFMGFL